MRFPKSAARKRRLAVLRQAAPTDACESGAFTGEFTGPATVELPSQEREFFSACRSMLPMRLSVSNERSGETEEVVIDRAWAVIGGAGNCDLRILHPDISQRHAYLQFADGRLFCRDLASRTGMHRANAARSSSWVTPGEPIYLGPYSIRAYPNEFLAEDADPAPSPADDVPRGDFPPVAFTIANVYDRTGRPKMRRIRRLVTLAGASQICPLRLQHASVGRAHCSFVWTPGGLWVVDLLCDGGTLVNGKPVSLAHLREGDEVGIGRFQLQVTYSPPSDDEPVGSAKAESSGELPAVLPAPPSGLNTVPCVSPPPVVFASADPEDEPVTSEEPTAERVAGTVAETGEAATVDEVGSAMPARDHTATFPSSGNLIAIRPAPRQFPGRQSASDPLAMALMQEISSVQQRSFDQMQQLLATMTKAFGAAYASQVELVRAELRRCHEIDLELQELNVQMTLEKHLRHEAAASLAATLKTAQFDGAPLRDPQTGLSRSPRREPIPPRSGFGADGAVNDPPGFSPDAPGASLGDRFGDRLRELEQERSRCWQRISEVLTPAAMQD